jgi:hypothetical protein
MSNSRGTEVSPGEADWTTGMALYAPKVERALQRRAGSVGWGGAAGTEYWIDPVTGIAVSIFCQRILYLYCPSSRLVKEDWADKPVRVDNADAPSIKSGRHTRREARDREGCLRGFGDVIKHAWRCGQAVAMHVCTTYYWRPERMQVQ